MQKTEALKRLTSIEEEAKQLRMIIEAKEKVIDRIKTFEDACAEVGENPNDSKYKTGTKDDIAYQKLKTIVYTLNEGWIPDWKDGKYKYWPYFDLSSGFGFSYASYVLWNSVTLVGSRLCFKSRELAEYAGRQFVNVYKDFMEV